MSAEQVLAALSDAGQAHASEQADAAFVLSLFPDDVRALHEMARCSAGAGLWTGLVAGMRKGNGDQPLLAAWAFAALLTIPECPVARILHAVSLEAFLHRITAALVRGGSRGSGTAAGADAGAMEEEAEQTRLTDAADGSNAAQLCTDALQDFAVVLGTHGLAHEPDMLRSVAESLAEITRSQLAPKPAVAACYAGLSALLHPRHGDAGTTASMVLRLVTPAIMAVGAPELGSGCGSCKVAATAPSRKALAASAAARDFVASMLREHPAAHEAVAALARHIVMKAPDKADFRALAADAAVGLIKELPAPAQSGYCAFLARLSRTPKVVQRMMAVDLAPRMLRAMPQAYSGPAATPLCASPCGTPTAMQMVTRLPSTGGSSGSGSAASERCMQMRVPTPATSANGATPPQVQQASPAATCLAVLLQRCSDKSAAVRARALSNLAGVVTDQLRSDGHNFRQALAAAQLVQHGLVAGQTPGSALPLLVSPAGSDEPGPTPLGDATNMRPGPLARAVPGDSAGGSAQQWGGRGRGLQPSRLARLAFTNAALAQQDLDIESLVRTARRRAADEKATVRKAGVALLEALLLLRAGPPPPLQRLPSGADMAALQAAARDPLVSVRKAALTAARRLLEAAPLDASVAQLWLGIAAPMVEDLEAALQEAALGSVHEVLLAPAAAASAPGSASAADAARRLRVMLGCLSSASAGVHASVSRACLALAAKKRLPARAAASGLQAIIESSDCQEGERGSPEQFGAWLLLADVAAQEPAAICWKFLGGQWAAMQQQPGALAAGNGSRKRSTVLRIIAAAAAHSGAEEAKSLTIDLLKALHTFDLPMDAIVTHMAAVSQLASVSGAAGGWRAALLADAERLLRGYVGGGGSTTSASAQAHDAGGDATETSLGAAYNLPGGRGMASMTTAEARAAAAVFTVGQAAALGGTAKAPGGLVVLVQALTAQRLAPPAGAAHASAPADGTPVPGPLQAHAWTALGKLCLGDEALAKACVPHFAAQLRGAALPAVRNNIAVALTDMCIAYTGLVDAHVPRLAACLRDEHELVRCQALALLAHLLQKDFVKWRGPLLHRFLAALVDESPRIRSLADYLLSVTLAAKAPLLAYNSFVEVVFSLNRCREGLAATALQSQGAEDAGGVADMSAEDAAPTAGPLPAARAKRDVIYAAMLRRMSPEHRFGTAARLSAEVLGGVADEALALDACGEVLGDALRILTSEHIKVSGPKGAAAAAAEDPSDAAAAVGVAHGRVVSSLMRKHLVGVVVPIALQLKRQLEAARHPLLGDLMLALASLLADHKHEVEEILAADPQTAKELLYDIRQAAAGQRSAAAAAALARSGRAAAAWCRGADPGTALRLAHSTPGFIGLLDAPAAADALHGDGPGSAQRLRERSSSGRLTPRMGTPRSGTRLRGLQTPAPLSMPASGGGGSSSGAGSPGCFGGPDSPLASLPRLRRGSALRGGHATGPTAAAADANAGPCAADDAPVVVRPPAQQPPWRLSPQAAGAPSPAPEVVPTRTAGAKTGKQAAPGRRAATRGKKRGRAA